MVRNLDPINKKVLFNANYYMNQKKAPEGAVLIDRPATKEERLIFGRNLREARRAAGLTQRDITRMAGYAQSFISDVETGACAINIDNMGALARLVDVPLWKLLKP